MFFNPIPSGHAHVKLLWREGRQTCEHPPLLDPQAAVPGGCLESSYICKIEIISCTVFLKMTKKTKRHSHVLCPPINIWPGQPRHYATVGQSQSESEQFQVFVMVEENPKEKANRHRLLRVKDIPYVAQNQTQAAAVLPLRNQD